MKINIINSGLAYNTKTCKNQRRNNNRNSTFQINCERPLVSFKMAYIDIDEASKKNKLFQKYIADKHIYYKYNGREAHPEQNESPVFYMNSKELESACQELSQYPFLLKKMFLIQDRGGHLPAHHFDAEQMAIMVMALKEFLPEKSDEISQKIFNTPDKYYGSLPAHNFKDPKSLSIMCEAVGEKEAVSILTKKDKLGFYPINNYYREPGMIYKTIDIMRNHKPELIKVLNHCAPTDEEKEQKYSGVLFGIDNDRFYGRDNQIHSNDELIMDSSDIKKATFYLKKDDINLIFDIFKDNEEDLRSILFSKDKYGSSFIFNCDYDVEEALYNNLRSKNYVNLLKDLYTCTLNDMTAGELQIINGRNILDLAANSDLDIESSLEMLEINKNALMQRYPSEYYTIVNELEEILERRNK